MSTFWQLSYTMIFLCCLHNFFSWSGWIWPLSISRQQSPCLQCSCVCGVFCLQDFVLRQGASCRVRIHQVYTKTYTAFSCVLHLCCFLNLLLTQVDIVGNHIILCTLPVSSVIYFVFHLSWLSQLCETDTGGFGRVNLSLILSFLTWCSDVFHLCCFQNFMPKQVGMVERELSLFLSAIS